MNSAEMQRYIENTLEAYVGWKRRGVDTRALWRHLGALECALLVVGVLKPGMPFAYKEIDVEDWYIFFTRRYRRLEKYPELIERLVREWLWARGYDSWEGKA